jgi:ethanolamine transporter EutH
MDLPLPEYKDLASATKFLSTPPKYEAKLPKKIIIEGKEFDVISDIKKMTAGQYIDYQTYIGLKDNKYLPHILSCFVIPKGEKYGQTNVEEIIQLFNEKMNILYALSISAFFLRKWQSLTKGTLRYFIWKMKRMKKKEKNKEVMEKMEQAISLLNTIRNGVGLDWLYE